MRTLPPDAGPARRNAESVLARTAGVWGIVWSVGLVSGLLDSGDWLRSWSVAWVAVIMIVAVYLALLARPSLPATPIILMTGITAVVVAADTVPASTAAGNVIASSWLNLACVVTGFLLARPAAARTLVVLITGFLVTLLIDAADNGLLVESWRAVALSGFYALAYGLAASGAAHALRARADIVDTETGRLAEQGRREAQRAGHRAEMERLARALHDTVVNTLGAIRTTGRGTVGVRERARNDLDVLTTLLDPPATSVLLSQVTATAVSEAATLGLALVVRAGADTEGALLPPAVAAATTGALREALINVSKHTTRHAATLSLAQRPDGSLGIRVVDTGGGWDGTVPDGRGIAESILARVAAEGGHARVVPGATGTAVSLDWPAQVLRSVQDPIRDGQQALPDVEVDAELAATLRQIVLESAPWLLLISVAAILLYGAAHMDMTWSLIVFAAIIAGAWTAYQQAGVRLPLASWRCWALLALIPATLVLPRLGVAVCAASDMDYWSLDAALVPAFIVVLLGGRWFYAVSAVACYAVGLAGVGIIDGVPTADCAPASIAMFAMYSGAIIAIAMYRRFTVRLWRQAREERVRVSDLMNATAAAEARDRARSRHLRTVLASASPFLAGIAEGALDPADPAVRALAGQQEEALRGLLRLDPDLGEFGAVLAEVVLLAQDAGRTIEIRAGEVVAQPEAAQTARIEGVLRACVAAAPSGSVMPVALFDDPDGVVTLTVVLERCPATPGTVVSGVDVHRCAAVGVAVTEVDLGEEVLVEIRWAA